MKVIELASMERTYKNAGQHAECVVRFTYTGNAGKADNTPHTMGGDVLDIQIKSARATVCHGTDLNAYLAMDGAKRFGYVNAEFTKMYLMDKAEYIEFVNEFGTVTYDSQKNGGGAKIRLKSESKAMVEWLNARA